MSLRRRMNTGFYSQLVQYGTLAALGAFALGAKRPGAPISPTPAVAAVTSQAGYVAIPRGAHPLARSEFDIGRLSPDKRIENLSLAFKLSPAQTAERDALVEAVSNPKSSQATGSSSRPSSTRPALARSPRTSRAPRRG